MYGGKDIMLAYCLLNCFIGPVSVTKCKLKLAVKNVLLWNLFVWLMYCGD